MAKFEANIPSYLKSGAGSVPIDNNFEKITGQPQNLSEVIDNYTKNFSGGIRTPDNLVADSIPVQTSEQPQEILPSQLDLTQVKMPKEVELPEQRLTDEDLLIA
jgi:hypothetical protein